MIVAATLCENLEELASRDLQEKLWLHGHTNCMSSFEEATCGVFDDAGLTRAMDSGYLKRTFSDKLNQKVHEFSGLVMQLPDNAHPKEIIDHSRMNRVRVVAAELISLFSEEGLERDSPE